MISEIRNRLSKIKGDKITIYVDIGRNKDERYTGKIINTYNYVWTFKTDTELKCFSYNDVLCNYVIINSLY